MHLVGYFYETYQDAWSPEHKVLLLYVWKIFFLIQLEVKPKLDTCLCVC